MFKSFSGHISMVYTAGFFRDIDAERAIQELEQVSPELLLSPPPKLSPSPSLKLMINTGAANQSTAGQDEFLTLQKIQDVKLNKLRKEDAKVQFGIGATSSLGTIDVMTPIGKITFNVVAADTPFLRSLKDLDDLGAIFDNLKNVLIQEKKRTPITGSYGHVSIVDITAFFHRWKTKPAHQNCVSIVTHRRQETPNIALMGFWNSVASLSKQLQWQIDNPTGGLRFVELDTYTLWSRGFGMPTAVRL
jgi:hypothetical protein